MKGWGGGTSEVAGMSVSETGGGMFVTVGSGREMFSNVFGIGGMGGEMSWDMSIPWVGEVNISPSGTSDGRGMIGTGLRTSRRGLLGNTLTMRIFTGTALQDHALTVRGCFAAALSFCPYPSLARRL